MVWWVVNTAGGTALRDRMSSASFSGPSPYFNAKNATLAISRVLGQRNCARASGSAFCPAITHSLARRKAGVPHDPSSQGCTASMYNRCSHSIRPYDTESHSGRILSLAGRPGIRQFLCSLPRREALVLGDVLVDRRLLQLDHRAGHAGYDSDQRPALRAAGSRRWNALLVLFLGHDVGNRRTHLRAQHALSGDVARHGGRARLLCRLRRSEEHTSELQSL